VAQGGQVPPPQSTSVSCPSFTPSAHWETHACALVHTSPVLQSALVLQDTQTPFEHTLPPPSMHLVPSADVWVVHAPEVHCAARHAVPVTGQSLAPVHAGVPELLELVELELVEPALELEVLELEVLEVEPLAEAAPAPPLPPPEALVPDPVEAPPVFDAAVPPAPLLAACALLAVEVGGAAHAAHAATATTNPHPATDLIWKASVFAAGGEATTVAPRLSSVKPRDPAPPRPRRQRSCRRVRFPSEHRGRAVSMGRGRRARTRKESSGRGRRRRTQRGLARQRSSAARTLQSRCG
jgi:hypothetical protein